MDAHPDRRNGNGFHWLPEANRAISAREAAQARGEPDTWAGHLDEVVLRAFSQTCPEDLRAALVQLAAGVAGWIGALDREVEDLAARSKAATTSRPSYLQPLESAA